MRNIGDEFLPDSFEASKLCRVMHHDNRPWARLAWQRCHLHREMKLLRAFPGNIETLGAARGNYVRDRLMQRVIAHYLQQRAAFDAGRHEREQLSSRGVRELHSFAIIHRDDAFDHSTQHGRLSLAALAKPRQLRS